MAMRADRRPLRLPAASNLRTLTDLDAETLARVTLEAGSRARSWDAGARIVEEARIHAGHHDALRWPARFWTGITPRNLGGQAVAPSA
jgi:hypothetical protein